VLYVFKVFTVRDDTYRDTLSMVHAFEGRRNPKIT
jgi:hypothetical protein